MTTAIAETKQSFSLAPQNIDEAIRFAEMLSKSSLVPKDFNGNPGNVLVAIQWGMELGLQPLQAMQNIAVINGRPSLWGDAVIGIVKASPLCEYVVEETTEDRATCKVKRRGEPEQVRVFTKDDAQKAGLLGKQGPWTQYPKRMMQMRARSWALRDVFPDVLRGMPIYEEEADKLAEKDVTPPATQDAGSEKPAELPFLDEATFNAFAAKHKPKIADGTKQPNDFIVWIESKGSKMTDDQKMEVASWAKKPDVIEGEFEPANEEEGGQQ
jgi:hypothetical protein